MAAARIRKMPQKKVSPMPERGPIRAIFTELMEAGSKCSGSLLYCSSIAMEIPMTKVEGATVMLKTSMWRLSASLRPSGSSL